jgi:hypothetical protein
MRLPLASVGQTGAASCAAASQDLAAIGSSHALAEPVDLGAMTLLRLIGTNHSDTPPVSISSGMQASANHNSRIAPAAVVNQLCAIPFHDYAKIIIAEKKCLCQPKISEEKWEKSVIFSLYPRYSGVFCFWIHLFGKFFSESYTNSEKNDHKRLPEVLRSNGEMKCNLFSGASCACRKTLLGLRVPALQARVRPRSPLLEWNKDPFQKSGSTL